MNLIYTQNFPVRLETLEQPSDKLTFVSLHPPVNFLQIYLNT